MAAASQVHHSFFNGRFADAETVDFALHQDAAAESERQQPRFHLALEHREHFARHARHRGEPRIADPHPDAGGRAAVVRNCLGPGRDHGLHAVAFGHRSAAIGEHLADTRKRRFIQNQIDACDFGDNFAGQVILRRSEAAGGENNGRADNWPYERLRHSPRNHRPR